MNNVLPGFIDSLPETSEFLSRIPMQRDGRTEEVAGVIAFLASDGAGYITGQDIRVDGGITRSVQARDGAIRDPGLDAIGALLATPSEV